MLTLWIGDQEERSGDENHRNTRYLMVSHKIKQVTVESIVEYSRGKEARKRQERRVEGVWGMQCGASNLKYATILHGHARRLSNFSGLV